MQPNNIHIPVLAQEVVSFVPQSAKIAFDGTLGGGGHTRLLLQQGLRVTSSDLDSLALTQVEDTLEDQYRSCWTPVHQSFEKALRELPNETCDFILADLGFSSNQLKSSRRGFSYKNEDEILDLRYNAEIGVPAWKKIQKSRAEDVSRILFRFSGETLSQAIAKALDKIKKSEERPLFVKDIVQAIDSTLPKKFRHKRNAILSRVWQALRIWTNNEFDILKEFLECIPQKLSKGGRAAIICFHSLEDKLVASYFRTLSRPIVIDDYGNKEYRFKLLTKNALQPSANEIASNPRSRSALLRVLEKL